MKSKKEIAWVSMPDNDDYVMRPVIERMCMYESLMNGTVDLLDIARMNDMIDVRNENESRYREANE